MMLLLVFCGNTLSAIFSKDSDVVLAAHSYLKAYAIDCLISPMMFCFIGYFNGCEKTIFVMLQGFIGAYVVRLPIVLVVSRIAGVNLVSYWSRNTGLQLGPATAVHRIFFLRE